MSNDTKILSPEEFEAQLDLILHDSLEGAGAAYTAAMAHYRALRQQLEEERAHADMLADLLEDLRWMPSANDRRACAGCGMRNDYYHDKDCKLDNVFAAHAARRGTG
jgi:hypothetical protein